MTHQEDISIPGEILEVIIEQGLDGLGEAIKLLLNEAMKAERAKVLGAKPWERSAERKGYGNGFKPKTISSRLGKLEVAIPQVRGDVSFYPTALEKGQRSERALTLAVAEMYLQGVSTRKVKDVLEKLCGLDITSTQVSRATQLLDEELEKWRNRSLGCIQFLQLDARYEKIRHNGAVISCAVLIAAGVTEEGKRMVLGMSVSISEAEVYWREFLSSLKQRGLYGLKLITSDSHEGLKAALKATFNGVPWQRCQVHLQRNAFAYVPKKEMQASVAQDLRNIFNAPDRTEAERLLAKAVEKHQEKAPKLAQWMETNIPEGLTVFILSQEQQRRRLRTTNMLERLNREIKRRTRVAGLFPNEGSLLRLVSAILMEISEEWETGKIYLNPESV